MSQAVSRRRRADTVQGYLFISPWLIGFFALTLIPTAVSFYLSFTDYDLLSPPVWTGLDNFKRMFTDDPRYWKSVWATFYYAVAAVPLRLLVALLVALALNTKRRGMAFYRALTYAPSIIGDSVAVAVMWRQLFGSEGLVNGMLALVGLPSKTPWLGDPRFAIWTLILLAAWQFGSSMLIFLAGLKQIPGELYESASIDAASGARRFFGTVGYHAGLSLICLVMIYPILWLAGSSFKPPGEIWTRVYALIPRAPTLENYANGWKGFGGVSFAVYYRNTIFYAGVGTVAAILSSAVVAFGFARIDFPAKNVWFSCMIATRMLPAQIQIIPQYIMFNKLGWINSYSPLIVPRLFGQAFFIFMIMQFIRGIPRELDEAADIDGCGRDATFFRIILPLLKPAMFTAAIFSFYWTWSDFFTPLIYLNNPKIYTISLALRSFADPGGLTDWGAIFAMSFLSLIPVLALFVAFQRYLVQGIASTGIKG